MALNRILIEPFIASQPRAPREFILDIDASDVPLHGNQELTPSHRYYDHSCYLPLYVFCGRRGRRSASSSGAIPVSAGKGSCSDVNDMRWAMSLAWRAIPQAAQYSRIPLRGRRPALASLYPILYFDASRVKPREAGPVKNKPVYLAWGIFNQTLK